MDFYQTRNKGLGNIKGVGGGQREERCPRGKEARCNGDRRSRGGKEARGRVGGWSEKAKDGGRPGG